MVFEMYPLRMIKDNGPIFGGDPTLLRGRSENVADDIHPPSGGPGTGNKPWSTYGFVAGGGRDVVGTDLEIVHLVCEDGLQKNKHAVIPGTVFVVRPAEGTFFGKTDRVLVACLDFFSGSENRFCHTVLCLFRQMVSCRPLQIQIIPVGTGAAGAAVNDSIARIGHIGQ